MKLVRAITSIVLIISVFVIIILAFVHMPNRQCSSISVVPHTTNECIALSEKNVKDMIAKSGIETVGKKMKEVDVAAITNLLQNNPYVKQVNFIHFSGTKLVIDFTLRNIILHVYNTDGEQYFVDDEGYLIPYKSTIIDYLVIANGNLHQHYKKGAQAGKELGPIVSLANKLLADDFYSKQFRQIYRNANKQLELVSTIGNQVILFGDTADASDKLINLKHVYQEGLSRKGYDRYAQLDVRYKNRVIAHQK